VPHRRALRERGLAERNRRLGEYLMRRFGQKVALDDVQFDV
jgi:hypothetical protein